jgi:hypothetical protein
MMQTSLYSLVCLFGVRDSAEDLALAQPSVKLRYEKCLGFWGNPNDHLQNIEFVQVMERLLRSTAGEI